MIMKINDDKIRQNLELDVGSESRWKTDITYTYKFLVFIIWWRRNVISFGKPEIDRPDIERNISVLSVNEQITDSPFK
jgi:hypothetical protein